MTNYPISRPERVAAIEADGQEVEIVADADERRALAAFLGIDAVRDFRADLTVRRWRGEGVAVRGTVTATIEQACVVTLEPVEQHIEEAIDVTFLPAARLGRGIAHDVVVEPLGADPPEPLEGDTIDLAAIAVEHMALGIDPYPRAPGAEFDAGAYGVDDSEEEEPASPFAVLAKLRDGSAQER